MADTYYSHYGIDFVWDSEKNEKNKKKHGISFEIAAHVFEDELRIEFVDETHGENETRYNTIGLVHDVLTVVYCDRIDVATGSDDIRIISARRATKTEIDAYNNNLFGR